jgi:uncharacterized protein YecT (DUF1311 family)
MFAFAQTKNPCETASSTIEARECAQQNFAAKDRQLNSVYQAVLKQLDTYQDNGPATKKLLIVSQRRWLEFRDADCAAQQRLYQGGTVAAEIYLDCMVRHTEQRIKELAPVSWQAG